MMKDTGKDIKPGQLLPGLCSDARFLKYSVLFFDTERLQVYCNIFSGIKKSGNSLYFLYKDTNKKRMLFCFGQNVKLFIYSINDSKRELRDLIL